MNEIRHTYHGQLDDLRVDVVRLGLMASEILQVESYALRVESPPVQISHVLSTLTPVSVVGGGVSGWPKPLRRGDAYEVLVSSMRATADATATIPPTPAAWDQVRPGECAAATQCGPPHERS